jgi:hypothetical protein
MRTIIMGAQDVAETARASNNPGPRVDAEALAP